MNSSSGNPQLSELDSEKGQELSAPDSDQTKPKPGQELDFTPDSLSPGIEEKWVTGFTLFTIMGAISLVCFLMLLDIAIIVTVRVEEINIMREYLTKLLGCSQNYEPVSLFAGCWLVWKCLSTCEVRPRNRNPGIRQLM